MIRLGRNVYSNKDLFGNDSILKKEENIEKIINFYYCGRSLLQIKSSLNFVKLRRFNSLGMFYPKKIEIDPRAGRLKTILLTLSHEMIHAHQNENGSLIMTNKYTKWTPQNKIYTNEKISKMSRMERRKLPWEKEAYKMEREIMNKILENINS